MLKKFKIRFTTTSEVEIMRETEAKARDAVAGDRLLRDEGYAIINKTREIDFIEEVPVALPVHSNRTPLTAEEIANLNWYWVLNCEEGWDDNAEFEFIEHHYGDGDREKHWGIIMINGALYDFEANILKIGFEEYEGEFIRCDPHLEEVK